MTPKLSIECPAGKEPFLNTVTGKLECVQVCVPPAIPQATRDGSRACVTLTPPPLAQPVAVPATSDAALMMLAVAMALVAALAARGRM